MGGGRLTEGGGSDGGPVSDQTVYSIQTIPE